jgi:hypothetical protein
MNLPDDPRFSSGQRQRLRHQTIWQLKVDTLAAPEKHIPGSCDPGLLTIRRNDGEFIPTLPGRSARSNPREGQVGLIGEPYIAAF